ncbi:MAG: Lipid A biosynthesis lauroyltransferase [Alphaproteobacteria bacterium MarineAlpha5_Bin11]|nr:MAG: Lipid A biosynthesis lauroyltransferase [Alphaproteobacteria bacterium MarineAlpha5_Bin11]PPR52185.1 MAG: Lipid A biosynthesis lauroyltransferase [Alphaproteobacteria bacterium MarineAlpha5_Bin10]|tara:strand:- start:7653 stop:8543 length:891 start_codon:yes stop_codon:yes gene_type:complete
MLNNLKKIILYPVQFIIFILIYYILRILPDKFSSDIGGSIFKKIGPFSKSHKIILNNLEKVYKNNEKRNFKLLANDCWENLGRTISEFSHLDKILINKNSNIRIIGEEHLKRIAEKNEQVIFIAIHQANWEILGPKICSYGIRLCSIYRHINNYFINKFIYYVRTKAYNTKELILSPKGKKSAQDMIMSIKKGFSIALLIDQKDSSGLNVPLLGQSCKTQTAFLKLSKKFNLKIYPIQNRRLDRLRFEMIVHNPIEPMNINDQKSEIDAMKNIHNIIEEWIKKQPESWLWQHNRWG